MPTNIFDYSFHLVHIPVIFYLGVYIMAIQFELSTVIKAPIEDVFTAWLDSEKHSAMTGGEAVVSNQTGDSFSAWDGYITGKNLEIKPYEKIVQSWRTSDFEKSEPDSRLEILFKTAQEGTKLILIHSSLPPHGTQYEQGWIDNYFIPIKEYFAGKQF
jgi:uncharacterized protein YndB with AHSA1/START domain